MPDSRLAPSYARAIHDAAMSRWISDLAGVRDRLREDESAAASLNDASQSFGVRKALADRLLPDEAAPELRNLIYTLVEQGHLGLLDDIIAELRRLARGGRDVTVAEVTSVIELDEGTRGQIERRLISRYGDGVEVEWRVDPQIIGGVVIKVGDELIDGSLATRLETLRNTLRGSA